MGESMVDFSNFGDKMGETAASDAVLEVSVSFGRFDNDLLSWEKWSSFSTNKYLEEVEKCATPGSVAEKKAYFEARYKKIAARNVVLLDQEKQMENNCSSTDYQHCGDLIGNNCGTDINFDKTSSQDSATEANKQETSLISEVSSTHMDDANVGAAVTTIECRSSSVEEVQEERDIRLDCPEFNEPVKAYSVQENLNPSIEPQVRKEIPNKLESMVESAPKPRNKFMKSDRQRESLKTIATTNNERNMAGVKKKPAPPTTKAPKPLNSRVSKLAPNPTMSASRASIKKVNGSSIPRSKIASAGEGKTVVPKSLHMSLSLAPASREPASLTTTRKSFMLEKMGDKDVIKRAFNTFQNNSNPLKSSGEERSSLRKQVPAKGTEVRISTAMAPRKENGGSLKTVGAIKRSPKPTPSSFGLLSDGRAEKWKEKLEEKSKPKMADRSHVQSKSKVQKEVDTKKLRQYPKSRAIPSVGSYQEQKALKNPTDKDTPKNVIHS